MHIFAGVISLSRWLHGRCNSRWTWRWRVALVAAILIGCGAPAARAQMPGGEPIPSSSLQSNDLHGRARIGYSVIANVYRLQGEYSLTANLTRIGVSPLYFFADVDIEILSGGSQSFQPDRQTGTFELGLKRAFGIAPLGIFLRHQSPHNIDRNDRRQGSWEAIGARWQQQYKGSRITLSTGPYVHRVATNYRWDLDAQAVSPLGWAGKRQLELTTDVHHIFENGGGFTDFWIEPGILLSPHLEGYIGAGQLHDVDVYGGRTDTPLQVGVKFLW